MSINNTKGSSSCDSEQSTFPTKNKSSLINIDNSRCDDNAQSDQSTVPTRSKSSLISIGNTRCDDSAPTSHNEEYISLKTNNTDLMDDSTRTQPKISNSNDLSNHHAISKRVQATSKVNSQSKRFSPCPFSRVVDGARKEIAVTLSILLKTNI